MYVNYITQFSVFIFIFIHFYVVFVFSSVQEFIKQFGVLLPKNATACKEDISPLFKTKMALDPTSYQIGKTKVLR